MNSSLRRRRRWLRRLALGLAVAALAAPTANAIDPAVAQQPAPDGNISTWGFPAQALIPLAAPEPSDPPPTYVPALPPDLRYPGEGLTPAPTPEMPSAGEPGPGGPARVEPPQSVRPDDRPGARGRGAIVTRGPVVATQPGGFDWTDAGIGAAIACASVLLLAVGMTAIRRRGTLAHS